ncbi:hypothetical protein K432DRAFT_101320 [Lepidopterella palustris CBS 459.81]|uniref:F-box domain-containing protein n=1 Tax=Lepidopterella palustris CBS 459.81 TaxID=1314670 RepID=A0A8E2E697_9PEZI|nr:hypothetical protein K432DRAFT_101320 [Lepidopterella palustris CBS 459.81]
MKSWPQHALDSVSSGITSNAIRIHESPTHALQKDSTKSSSSQLSSRLLSYAIQILGNTTIQSPEAGSSLSAPNTQTEESSRLLLLPAELRLQIWFHVFSPPHFKIRRALALLRTNHQIYSEAFPLAFPNIRFCFRNTTAFTAHLLMLEPRQLSHLNHIKLHANGFDQLLDELQMISEMKGLRLSTLTFALSRPTTANISRFCRPKKKLRPTLDSTKNVRCVFIENHGFRSDWDFVLFFINMHNYDTSRAMSLHDSLALTCGSWEYALRGKGERGPAGYAMVMRALD